MLKTPPVFGRGRKKHKVFNFQYLIFRMLKVPGKKPRFDFLQSGLPKPKPKQKGASLFQQKRWANMPQKQKSFNRLLLPDRDRDGTPDFFDCRPFNPFMQGYLHRVRKREDVDKYEDQVRKIARNLGQKFIQNETEKREIIQKWQKRPDVMERKLKQKEKEAQPENTGAFDFLSIYGDQIGQHKFVPDFKGAGFNLIVKDEKVVGAATISDDGEGKREIKSLYITPDNRKKGIGKSVVKELFEEQGAKKVVGVAIPQTGKFWDRIGADRGTPEARQFEKGYKDELAKSGAENVAMELANMGMDKEQIADKLWDMGIRAYGPEGFTYENLPEDMKRDIDEMGEGFEITEDKFKKVKEEEDNDTTIPEQSTEEEKEE